MTEQPVSSYPNQPNIIPPTPKMSRLPPLPSQHHRFMPPPAFPPPFFAQIPPPMFPPNPSYHILPNQPPPLMGQGNGNNKDNKKLIKTEEDKNKTLGMEKNGKVIVKKQENKEQEHHDANNNQPQPQSTPMMFPFGNQSPTMFPQNVGPMQSPLFSMNNVPQTPYFQSTNGGNGAFLPGPNPNAHNVGNHHSSLSQYHSFGHTASTLPMPLSLPMNNMMHPKDENDKEPKNTSNASSSSSSSASSSSSSANSESNEKKSNSEHRHSRSPTPHSRAQSLNPGVSTITAMSGLTQDSHPSPDHHHHNNNSSGMINPFQSTQSHSRSSSNSICNTSRATMGSPTATLRSNPPQSKSAISVDSGISRLSQSASLSAVATAGGLTVNTPLPSMNGHHHPVNGNGNGGEEGGEDEGNDNHLMSAHAPPPLMSRFNHYLPSNPPHTSSNTSIDTQVGSMPPLNPDPSGNNSTKSTPLHQRRRQSAPTSLAIPFA